MFVVSYKLKEKETRGAGRVKKMLAGSEKDEKSLSKNASSLDTLAVSAPLELHKIKFFGKPICKKKKKK